MNPTVTNPYQLNDAVANFSSEVEKLELIFASCFGNDSVMGYQHTYVPTEDGCLVSLWDAWNRFLRTLAIASASGAVASARGVVYSPACPRTEMAALAHLKKNQKKFAYRVIGDEPNWNIVKAYLDIIECLELDKNQIQTISGAIAASDIDLGVAIVNNPLEEVRACRNFIAHKSRGTLDKVKVYSNDQYTTLSQHLRRMRFGVEKFSEWKDCMTAIAVASIQ